MLVHNKKSFFKGLIMLVTFVAVFITLLSPVFPDINDKTNSGKKLIGLDFADAVFNSLSKGSSNFIPMVEEKIKPLNGKNVEVTIKMKHPELADTAVKVLSDAKLETKVEGSALTYKGDMGPFLEAVTQLSDKMYHNDGASVSQKYGVEKPLDVTSACWEVLQPSIKELQKQGLIKEAQVIDTVVRRAIEPAHNFYSIEPTSVKEHIVLMTALLVFYLLYTLWYGFGIADFFEGLGLTMSKSKVKKEG